MSYWVSLYGGKPWAKSAREGDMFLAHIETIRGRDIEYRAFIFYCARNEADQKNNTKLDRNFTNLYGGVRRPKYYFLGLKLAKSLKSPKGYYSHLGYSTISTMAISRPQRKRGTPRPMTRQGIQKGN